MPRRAAGPPAVPARDIASPRRRVDVHVGGVVQGVGFRPHVYALADDLGLDGFVRNGPDGVRIEVEGPPDAITAFLDRLSRQAPPLALVEHVDVGDLPATGVPEGFTILTSTSAAGGRTLVSPDVATCDACLAEVADPDDRRHGYPFTNCTDCGPRFTIVRDVPYDRAATTMAGFSLCTACREEYDDPVDRRFHAQPVCCPGCGPTLVLHGPGIGAEVRDPIGVAARLLRDGAVVAVKGLGGYHLAVDARLEPAVATLRSRKHREEKPFAVLVADLAQARRYGEVDEVSARLLTDRARPIVLVPRGAEPVAASVAPGNRSLGLLLPYTPLHHLLTRAVDGPVVLTSGNVSDEPIAHDDAEALLRLAPIADAFVTHDRPIHVRTDDSVARVVAGRPLLLRRSRGFAPGPVTLPDPVPRAVLAVGAELKSTVCVAAGRHAFLSQHVGDLENHETYVAFLAAIEHLGRLFAVTPEVVAHDLHPEYLSTKHVLELPDGLPRIGVQHHHAHVASCLVDNGRRGPVIGVAFDGTGYGPDGTIWGGEVLVADLAGYERVGHLAPVPLPGGAAAIREPWRMAVAYLDVLGRDGATERLPVHARNARRWDLVRQVGGRPAHAPSTSSAGRLFDAVAALLDVRDVVTYEGQAAIELEQAAGAAAGERGYPVTVGDDAPFVIDGPGIVGAVLDDRAAGTDRSRIAARFHATLADAVALVCGRVRDLTGLGEVALTGGVFQNALLTALTLARLQERGFTVLTHRQVPPNDGGISLGQVAVAAAQDAEGTIDVGPVNRRPAGPAPPG